MLAGFSFAPELTIVSLPRQGRETHRCGLSRATMPPVLEAESTLTDRYQTTVPRAVRRALGLGKRDRIHYAIRPGGQVVLTRVDPADPADPALAVALRRLAQHLATHPEQALALDAEVVARIEALADELCAEAGARLEPAPD